MLEHLACRLLISTELHKHKMLLMVEILKMVEVVRYSKLKKGISLMNGWKIILNTTGQSQKFHKKFQSKNNLTRPKFLF